MHTMQTSGWENWTKSWCSSSSFECWLITKKPPVLLNEAWRVQAAYWRQRGFLTRMSKVSIITSEPSILSNRLIMKNDHIDSPLWIHVLVSKCVCGTLRVWAGHLMCVGQENVAKWHCGNSELRSQETLYTFNLTQNPNVFMQTSPVEEVRPCKAWSMLPRSTELGRLLRAE